MENGTDHRLRILEILLRLLTQELEKVRYLGIYKQNQHVNKYLFLSQSVKTKYYTTTAVKVSRHSRLSYAPSIGRVSFGPINDPRVSM